MLAQESPLRVDVEQRIVARCAAGFRVAFAHPHDDVDASTLRNTTESVSGFAGNTHCIRQQVRVQFVEEMLFTRCSGPDPDWIARMKAAGKTIRRAPT